MAASRDDECRVLRDANVMKRAANKCSWLLRRAESLLSRAKERLTAHADGLLSSAKERLTACADSLSSRAEERQTTHADGLLSSARQGAMSADERADERAASNSADVLEAIQNLPPDHLKMIYKDYVTMKQREREALGWTKVHKQILKLPFCEFMQQIVPTVLDPYPYHPSLEGCCYPCFIKE